MGAAVAAEVIDDLAVEAGDGDGLLEGEVEGLVDGVVFGGEGEGWVLERRAAEAVEQGLNVGAGVADETGERTLRGSK